MQGSLHCKQGSLYIGDINLQLPVVYETESTTSRQYNTHLLEQR